MALNIKNREVERLATEVAEMARETKTEAIRRALEERKLRLSAYRRPRKTKEELIQFFEREIWPQIPPDLLGKSISKEEREEILGYGPNGV